MSRVPNVRLSFEMKPCKGSHVTGLKWHFIAGVACLSVALLADLPLFAQITPEQRLTDAYRLEREGSAGPAITQLKLLLDSKSLDAAGVGKAWNVLGLAFEDQGDFSASRRAFEQSIHAYHGVPNNTAGCAMALDDFGELDVATGQFDSAVQLMGKALHLYEGANDHAGIARSSSDLAGALFSQKKLRQGRANLDRALTESRLTNDLDDDDLAALASLQGWLAQSDGDLATSVSKYQQSLDLLKKRHGEEHAFTGWGYVLLGQVQAEAGDLKQSLPEIVQGLSILRRTLNGQDPRFLAAEIAYSRVLDLAGKRSEARSIRADAEGQLRTFRNSQCIDCTISARAFH